MKNNPLSVGPLHAKEPHLCGDLLHRGNLPMVNLNSLLYGKEPICVGLL